MQYFLTCCLVFWVVMIIFARNGKGGSLGKNIRESDWRAWNDAMQDKQREIDQLRNVEPKI